MTFSFLAQFYCVALAEQPGKIVGDNTTLAVLSLFKNTKIVKSNLLVGGTASRREKKI